MGKIVLRTAAGATSGVKSTEIKYYKRMERSSLLVRIRNNDNAEYIHTLLRREKIHLHRQK